MKRDQVFEFFRRLAEANPSPTTELDYINPYTLLVAVVLSAQATDASVNIATGPLFERVKTPKQMVELGEERLRQAIK
ncbi:MAG: endonuclease III domain-containing protein, partial [Sphingomicrobium sp.]